MVVTNIIMQDAFMITIGCLSLPRKILQDFYQEVVLARPHKILS